MSTLTYQGTLVITSCWCGIQCAIPRSLYTKAQSDEKQVVFCPLGHEFVYSTNKATRLQAELDRMKADRDWEANRRREAEVAADHERAVAAGYKGAVTKMKKRVGKGVCPCCNRHFANVERHMATKHPDVAAGEV